MNLDAVWNFNNNKGCRRTFAKGKCPMGYPDGATPTPYCANVVKISWISPQIDTAIATVWLKYASVSDNQTIAPAQYYQDIS